MTALKRTIIATVTFLYPATAAAQATWSAQYSPTAPAATGIDNIGAGGQVVFGVERVSGLFLDRLSRTDDTGPTEETQTDKGTVVGLFGMTATSPASVPRLALDYFVVDGFSIGGSFVFVPFDQNLRTERGGAVPVDEEIDVVSGSQLVLNVRGGFAYPFDETFGIWARGGFAWMRQNAEVFSAGDPAFEFTDNFFDITLDAMFVISPFEHFALLLGPYLDLGLAGSSDEEVSGTELDATLTSFGLSFALSGYWP